MSNAAWTLEPNAEREILLPWLASEPDPATRERVLRYLADVLEDPDRPLLLGETAIYSTESVPGTSVGMAWILNAGTRELILAYVG